MTPLSGMEIYREMFRRNRWVADHLPNISLVSETLQCVMPAQKHVTLQRVVEKFLSLPFGDWFEKWEMNRKVARLRREQAASFESYFSADVCKGHVDRHGQKTESAIREKLEQVAVEL
jgi:hypothetical protein